MSFICYKHKLRSKYKADEGLSVVSLMQVIIETRDKFTIYITEIELKDWAMYFSFFFSAVALVKTWLYTDIEQIDCIRVVLNVFPWYSDYLVKHLSSKFDTEHFDQIIQHFL